jgi:hypothetical protein
MKALKLSLATLAATLVAAQAQAFCTNDDDCACGQVCSYDGTGQNCVQAGTDPGWCTQGGPQNGGCLYEGQICCGIYCYPAWTSSSVCTNGTSGGATGGSTGSLSCPVPSSGGTSTGGSSSGGSSTAGGGSSSGGVASSSSGGGSSSGGVKGTSSGGVEGSSSTGGAGGTTGSTSSTSGGGGCSHAPGDVFWPSTLLALGLFARSRRRRY